LTCIQVIVLRTLECLPYSLNLRGFLSHFSRIPGY
jgi:hypothetical protein